MRAPGLVRGAVARALAPHYLALSAALAALPAALAVIPLWRFLASQLDRALDADARARALDLATLVDLAKALGDGGHAAAVPGGLLAGLLAAAVASPIGAGAALTLARAADPPRVRALLAGAGELYGRLLRTLLVAAIPLGVAGLAAAGLSKAAEKAVERAVTETVAARIGIAAAIATALLYALAQLTLDAGRAHLAAQPERRSALLAWAAGARLVLRRPAPALLLGLVAALVSLGGAFAAMALRGRIDGGGPFGVAARLVLAQLAVACVAWGRGLRLAGLTDLAGRDLAARARARAGIREG